MSWVTIQGTVLINPNTLPTGSYYVKVKTPYHLKKFIGGIININAGQINTIPPATLVAGDANDENALTIVDYNMLLDCYSDLKPAIACNANKKVATDFNDDGSVNSVDYNILLREIASQPGG